MDMIVIYCSASNTIEEVFNINASKVIKGLCEKGYGIVSGGISLGTMRVVADAVAECGGCHKGVMPRFMKGMECEGLSESVWTETMSARKEEMRKDTVAAIAFPGGIGTLDELIETMVLKKLDQYHGRVIVLNVSGFFDSLLALLDHYVATGMLLPQDRALIESFDSAEALLESF